MNKPKLALPVIVEGKYDKIKLASLVEGTILTTEGFGLFRDRERLALLRRMASTTGVIVLTDPDGGGKQIRSFLSGSLGKGVYHLYIPAIHGKEKRKRSGGRAGLLGVEGVPSEVLLSLLSPFFGELPPRGVSLTKADLYEDGLLGKPESRTKRARLATRLSLPPDLTPNALLEALNLLVREEEYRTALEETEHVSS